MIRRLCHFDERAFQELIDQDTDNRLSRDLSDHLADCEECRQRFEELAAPSDWWQETTSVLSAKQTVQSRLTSETNDEWAPSQLSQYLSPADSPNSIGRIGVYSVTRVLGAGGMGIVFEAFDATLHRNVALKMMHPHFAVSGAARQRFGREARAAAAVVHANVVPIHAVIAEGNLPYLVMSYIPGESLQERLDRQGSLELSDCLSIAAQIADGLAAAHAQGLVHRDIKPANILLEQGTPRVWLTDFGLARTLDDATVTASGYIAGTPQFMSPEQANGDDVDHRSDLFSLGSVLYTMITGRPPFRADSSLAVLRRIVDHEPRPLGQIRSDTPLWLEALVAKLHCKRPTDRFESAAAVRDLLRQSALHLADPQRAALPPPVTQLATALKQQNRTMAASQKTMTNYRWFGIAVAACVLVCTVALAMRWSPFGQGPADDRQAERELAASNEAKTPAKQNEQPAYLPSAATYPAAPTPPVVDQADWYSIDMQLQDIRQRIEQIQVPIFNGASPSHE
jgi:serine/threonine-protein kinase